MTNTPRVMLKPVVRYREFPFGTANDPSMREGMVPRPWNHEAEVLEYLRSGLIFGLPLGADLIDWFDPPAKANPVIDGRVVGGTTEMTDGVWFWYAGLISFIEKYQVRLPDEFVRHAAQQGWRVHKERLPPGPYDYSYFEMSQALEESPV